jgi:hypothetical protein
MLARTFDSSRWFQELKHQTLPFLLEGLNLLRHWHNANYDEKICSPYRDRGKVIAVLCKMKARYLWSQTNKIVQSLTYLHP